MGGSLATTWLRYLFLRLSAEELRAVPWRVYLGPALVVTWLAGMGRYWDHPSASGLQMLGIGSIVYVFVLALVLWIVGGSLGARNWNYPTVVTLVALTSPPALLYAIPVERWMPMDRAQLTNVWFLAIVATWRVAILFFLLRRRAQLTWPRTLVGTLLPLTAIIAALVALNLEKAVFQIMAGTAQPPTSNDGAYFVLMLLAYFSSMAFIPLLAIYLVLVVRALRERRERRQIA